MATRVAISGLGRIGRLVLRALHESGRQDLEVVAVNDPADVETNAHLLRHDTAHGPFPGTVRTEGGMLDIGRGPMRYFQERDPAKLPWGDLDVDVVMECTGAFTKRDGAAKHLDAGARKVLISAPGKDADLTLVMGVNDDDLMPDHAVISNASCTTNCLAPIAKVLHDGLGIERGYMTTVHAVTGDQHTVDKNHKDLRRARAAGDNIIPTTTGAAKAAGLVIPELNGKLDGVAIRVPTVNVSLVDVTFDAARATTVGEVQQILRDAAASPRYKGIIGINDEPLVSSDFNHNPNSATVDINDTQVIDGTLVRVQAWYDNEWGFSHRMCDAAAAVGTLVK